MKTWIDAWIERLRTSYWFIPGLLGLAAVGLSVLTINLDHTFAKSGDAISDWIWTGGAEGARQMLSTIAGSMITVLGVVFSITIVALSLASTQFGPRLLRNFMGDRFTQVVLGSLAGTYLYCLLVLRTIRDLDETSFVPHISVTCGLLFAVLCTGLLIVFIHHVASSILAENVVARVADDLTGGIERLFPSKIGDETEDDDRDGGEEKALPFPEKCASVESHDSGFVQGISGDSLLKLAAERDLVIRITLRPGNFVAAGDTIAEVGPIEKIEDLIRDAVREAFILGRYRTPTQDLEYSIDQLVETAVRALSPGINDPFTAMSCIEWLGVALIELAGRSFPSAVRRDEEENPRLWIKAHTYRKFTDACFLQLRQYGCTSMAVSVRLLEVIMRVARRARYASDREALRHHAKLIAEDARAEARNTTDQADIDAALAAALEALKPTAQNPRLFT
ncbi:MAG: DUF2254 domain-containing protein [Chthoniobacteraceae bacterium]